MIDGLPDLDGDNDFVVGGGRPLFSKGRMAKKNKKIPFAKNDLFHPFYLSGRVINSVGWAYIFYVVAFCTALQKTFPEAGFFNPYECLCIVAVVIIGLAGSRRLQINPGKAKLPAAFYMCILVTMMVKASSLGIRCLIAGTPLCGAAAAVLIVGSLCFVLSDATLAMLNFGPKKTFPLKCFNIGTYYAAQVLLASTILFF